jgi:hypothetical protein
VLHTNLVRDLLQRIIESDLSLACAQEAWSSETSEEALCAWRDQWIQQHRWEVSAYRLLCSGVDIADLSPTELFALCRIAEREFGYPECSLNKPQTAQIRRRLAESKRLLDLQQGPAATARCRSRRRGAAATGAVAVARRWPSPRATPW